MKRAPLPLVVLLAMVSWASGQAVTDGDWTYIVENDGATITASTATGDVIIPSELDGYPVKIVRGEYNYEAFVPIFGYSNTSVTSVIIPDSVTMIGDGAFAYCSELTSVIIPKSVTSIGDQAFAECTGLTSVTIPDSVTSIGERAFQLCRDLTSVNIGNGVTSIGRYAFAECTGVTSVGIGNGVTGIGASAFENCSALTSVTIPDSVTSIGDKAFAGCTGLNIVGIGSGVTSIGAYAFAFCTGLTSVIIPDSVTIVGDNAFFLCTGLTSAIIGNGVTSIGVRAFRSCTALTSVIIGNSVTNIGDQTFEGTALSNVTIPFYTTTSPLAFPVSAALTKDYAALVGRDDFVTSLVVKLANTLATNNTFITNLAEAIKSANGTYGIATQSGVSDTITTATSALATKAEITTAINEGKASGIASVTAAPNTWSLFTTSQIQNMAVGDLMLSREVNGSFVLNYDIEQSEDLVNWTPYQALSLPLAGLPNDKAFIRIRAKQ